MFFNPNTFTSNYRVDVKEYFYSGSGVDNVLYQTWNKPKWAKFVYILLIGAGGAGGAGGSGIAGTNRLGGGGGAGGSLTKACGLAALFPDTLYISIGKGGIPGTNATRSIITTTPINLTSPSWIFMRASSGGNGGTNTQGAAGGTTAATISFNGAFINYNSHNGNAGGSGSVGSSGPGNISYISTSICCGGTGGGGVNTSNVAQQGAAYIGLTWIAASGQAAATGADGKNGFTLEPPNFPLLFVGGTGGGGNASGLVEEVVMVDCVPEVEEVEED